MNTDFIKDLLKQRRRRAVADVMGSLERSTAWPMLHDAERKHIRAAVYGAINGYHDVALDALAVLSDGHILIDQRVVDMITDLHNDLLLDDVPRP